jgi:hypothetical protein
MKLAPSNAAAVEAWLRETSQYPDLALRLWPLLHELVPRTNQIRPSLATLTNATGAPEEKLRIVVDELESIGAVFREDEQENALFLHPDILHYPDLLDEDTRDAAPDLFPE